MGLLKGTVTYTVGNLQYGCFDAAKSWRDSLKEQLSPLGIRILSPLDKMFRNFEKEGKDFNKELVQALKEGRHQWVHEQAKSIRSRDLSACDVSQFLIAYLDPTKPTFGSTDEIITAKRNLKPVFLILDGGYSNCPIWLCSYFKPHWVYPSLDKVVDTLKKIDTGEIEINTKYWKILENE